MNSVTKIKTKFLLPSFALNNIDVFKKDALVYFFVYFTFLCLLLIALLLSSRIVLKFIKKSFLNFTMVLQVDLARSLSEYHYGAFLKAACNPQKAIHFDLFISYAFHVNKQMGLSCAHLSPFIIEETDDLNSSLSLHWKTASEMNSLVPPFWSPLRTSTPNPMELGDILKRASEEAMEDLEGLEDLEGPEDLEGQFLHGQFSEDKANANRQFSDDELDDTSVLDLWNSSASQNYTSETRGSENAQDDESHFQNGNYSPGINLEADTSPEISLDTSRSTSPLPEFSTSRGLSDKVLIGAARLLGGASSVLKRLRHGAFFRNKF